MAGGFTSILTLTGVWLDGGSGRLTISAAAKPTMRWNEHWRSSHGEQKHGVYPGVRWEKHYKEEKEANAT